MALFDCSRCGQAKPEAATGGVGYGRNESGGKVCYACCALTDAEYMRTHDHMTLYLTEATPTANAHVSNWPDTLRFPVSTIRKGRHNIARTQYTAYFTFEGSSWIARQYGDNTQIAHCRRLKVAS